MEKDLSADIGGWITAIIEDFVATSMANSLDGSSGERAFASPLVGFSSGADSLYDEYVLHIGDFYLTPMKIFRKAFPEVSMVEPKDLTVISWVLPSTHSTRQEQSNQSKRPSERWARVRYYGEMFNESLRCHVVEQLTTSGIQAVAPMLAPFWSRIDKGPYAPCSNWSERHASYAAGLGTFGLCDGLITPVGKAMRTGSVVAHITITPSKRPYIHRHAYCLFYSQGSCGKCISRCPVKAISDSGHDKQRCMQYTEYKMKEYVLDTYGFSTSACGLCQAGVPCTDHIPTPEEG